MKPIQGRPLLVELIYEMNKFMPLNGLIKCCQANPILKELGIPRARKVHAKLISLYFADISTLAIWFKQWANQFAEVRTKIHRQTSNRLTLDPTWFTLLTNDLRQIDKMLFQLIHKFFEIWESELQIVKANQVDILARFNFTLAFQNELRQIRASHIKKALAPVKFELSQWRLENIPSSNEMLIHFRGDQDIHVLGHRIQGRFSQTTDLAKTCNNHLKIAVFHLKRRS